MTGSQDRRGHGPAGSRWLCVCVCVPVWSETAGPRGVQVRGQCARKGLRYVLVPVRMATMASCTTCYTSVVAVVPQGGGSPGPSREYGFCLSRKGGPVASSPFRVATMASRIVYSRRLSLADASQQTPNRHHVVVVIVVIVVVVVVVGVVGVVVLYLYFFEDSRDCRGVN